MRRGIESHVVGRRIERVEIGRERSVRRTGPEPVVEGLTGATITAATRRGKYIVCPLDSGEALMVHLRMSGRVLVRPAGEVRPPHCHVVLHLAPRKGGARDEMWFVDPRTFGEVVVFDPTRADETVPELARLGPDPVLDDFDGSVLAERLRGRRAPIKQVLLDQHVVAGIGNIYADEVLHRARVRGDRPADRLSRRWRRSGSRRHPVRRRIGSDGELPTRTPRLRPRGRAVPDLWKRCDPANDEGRAFEFVVPRLSAAIDARGGRPTVTVGAPCSSSL